MLHVKNNYKIQDFIEISKNVVTYRSENNFVGLLK